MGLILVPNFSLPECLERLYFMMLSFFGTEFHLTAVCPGTEWCGYLRCVIYRGLQGLRTKSMRKRKEKPLQIKLKTSLVYNRNGKGPSRLLGLHRCPLIWLYIWSHLFEPTGFHMTDMMKTMIGSDHHYRRIQFWLANYGGTSAKSFSREQKISNLNWPSSVQGLSDEVRVVSRARNTGILSKIYMLSGVNKFMSRKICHET